jgi:biotin carboxyl carrier protein
MENEVSAQKAGRIAKVNVAAGQSVMRGDVMLEIE